jgi:hypothetical protein
MNRRLVEEIANAVLYEGYILYPYRASAVKNRQRWNFGVLYPREFVAAHPGSDASAMHIECLVRSQDPRAVAHLDLRFLHLLERDDKWQEGRERTITLSSLSLSHPASQTFSIPASRENDGRFVRTHEAIEGSIEFQPASLTVNLFRIRVDISNTTPGSSTGRDQALLQSLASAHVILRIERGEFISLLDPPAELSALAAECKNAGAFPVLAGEPGARDAMLASPIILYDYPQIAPESAGALFDGTEIDEILSLRILTLTDDEKREMAEIDSRSREILARTESMPPEQFMKMHGVLRGLRSAGEKTA